MNERNQRTVGTNNLKKGLLARQVAATLLARVIDDQRNLDALCDSEHGLSRFLELEPRDRALVRAIVLAALRHRKFISAALDQLLDRPLPKNARHLIHTLHVAAAQILLLDVPDRAAVDLAVSSVRTEPRSTRFSGVANAILRRLAREKSSFIEQKPDDGSPFPKWMEKKIRSDHGREKLAMVSEAFLREASVDISVKRNPKKWAETLGGTILPNGSVRLATSAAVETLPGYDEGEWWVQDAASSIPASLLADGQGKDVLELCAAPGGKTAQLVMAGWKVTALDVSEPRVKRLERNLKRLQLEADCLCMDMFDYQADGLFDAVLLDAPCTSTGTIRRHPDVVWTKSQQDATDLAELQFRMLDRARTMLKPGGILIYSNCSVFKQEGEDLFSRSLEAFSDLQVLPVNPVELAGMPSAINRQGAIRTLPGPYPGGQTENLGDIDGFFVCRFKKR